jgi:hypothetical protein
MPIFDDIDRHHASRNKSRLRKQREYQADYRDRLRHSGTPDREDIAGEALLIVLSLSLRDWEGRGARWEQELVQRLLKRGFKAEATSSAFRNMLDREWARLQAKDDKDASNE